MRDRGINHYPGEPLSEKGARPRPGGLTFKKSPTPRNKTPPCPISSFESHVAQRREAMQKSDRDDGISRRRVLECMTWAGTGVLWTISGGVPSSLGLIDQAAAQEARGLTFLQISDSHVGFDKPANPNARGTLEEAIGQDQRHAGQAGVHDPHRRHQSSVKSGRVRRCRPHHLAGAARRALCSRRARLSSTKS